MKNIWAAWIFIKINLGKGYVLPLSSNLGSSHLIASVVNMLGHLTMTMNPLNFRMVDKFVYQLSINSSSSPFSRFNLLTKQNFKRKGLNPDALRRLTTPSFSAARAFQIRIFISSEPEKMYRSSRDQRAHVSRCIRFV